MDGMHFECIKKKKYYAWRAAGKHEGKCRRACRAPHRLLFHRWSAGIAIFGGKSFYDKSGNRVWNSYFLIILNWTLYKMTYFCLFVILAQGIFPQYHFVGSVCVLVYFSVWTYFLSYTPLCSVLIEKRLFKILF